MNAHAVHGAAITAAAAATAIDWERIRADFPLLHRQVHGKPLVYLDSATRDFSSTKNFATGVVAFVSFSAILLSTATR